MSEMSPLARMLVSILRWGCWVTAGFMVLFSGVFLYQKHMALEGADWRFLGLMVVMGAFAIYLALSMTRELNKNGG